MQDEIKQRITAVKQRIAKAQALSPEAKSTIQVLAVSKKQPSSAIRAAFAAGLRAFGENYLQEALPKIQDLADLSIEWHYIGVIQSNKTHDIAQYFAWAHSVTSPRIAQRLNDQRPAHLPPLQITLQVNISDEPSKAGVAWSEIPSLVAAVRQYPRLTLRGLMAMGAAGLSYEEQRQQFHPLAAALRALPGCDTLSMGMSDDLEAAIAEGANLVRVGTAIFGRRI